MGRQLVIATQTLAELHYGAEVAGWGSQRRDRLKRLVDSALLVPPDEKMCRDFGKLRARLRRIGHPLHQDDHTLEITCPDGRVRTTAPPATRRTPPLPIPA